MKYYSYLTFSYNECVLADIKKYNELYLTADDIFKLKALLPEDEGNSFYEEYYSAEKMVSNGQYETYFKIDSAVIDVMILNFLRKAEEYIENSGENKWKQERVKLAKDKQVEEEKGFTSMNMTEFTDFFLKLKRSDNKEIADKNSSNDKIGDGALVGDVDGKNEDSEKNILIKSDISFSYESSKSKSFNEELSKDNIEGNLKITGLSQQTSEELDKIVGSAKSAFKIKDEIENKFDHKELTLDFLEKLFDYYLKYTNTRNDKNFICYHNIRKDTKRYKILFLSSNLLGNSNAKYNYYLQFKNEVVIFSSQDMKKKLLGNKDFFNVLGENNLLKLDLMRSNKIEDINNNSKNSYKVDQISQGLSFNNDDLKKSDSANKDEMPVWQIGGFKIAKFNSDEKVHRNPVKTIAEIHSNSRLLKHGQVTPLKGMQDILRNPSSKYVFNYEKISQLSSIFKVDFANTQINTIDLDELNRSDSHKSFFDSLNGSSVIVDDSLNIDKRNYSMNGNKITKKVSLNTDDTFSRVYSEDAKKLYVDKNTNHSESSDLEFSSSRRDNINFNLDDYETNVPGRKYNFDMPEILQDPNSLYMKDLEHSSIEDSLNTFDAFDSEIDSNLTDLIKVLGGFHSSSKHHERYVDTHENSENSLDKFSSVGSQDLKINNFYRNAINTSNNDQLMSSSKVNSKNEKVKIESLIEPNKSGYSEIFFDSLINENNKNDSLKKYVNLVDSNIINSKEVYVDENTKEKIRIQPERIDDTLKDSNSSKIKNSTDIIRSSLLSESHLVIKKDDNKIYKNDETQSNLNSSFSTGQKSTNRYQTRINGDTLGHCTSNVREEIYSNNKQCNNEKNSEKNSQLTNAFNKSNYESRSSSSNLLEGIFNFFSNKDIQDFDKPENAKVGKNKCYSSIKDEFTFIAGKKCSVESNVKKNISLEDKAVHLTDMVLQLISTGARGIKVDTEDDESKFLIKLIVDEYNNNINSTQKVKYQPKYSKEPQLHSPNTIESTIKNALRRVNGTKFLKVVNDNYKAKVQKNLNRSFADNKNTLFNNSLRSDHKKDFEEKLNNLNKSFTC